MTWLVDTNTLSELRKGNRADAGVREWFDGIAEEDVFTSVLVLGELRRGIESLRRRDRPAALAIEQWLERLQDSFGDRIVPVTVEIADRWGILSVPDPLPTVDGLLAATAIVHDMVLVTRNTRDVARTGVRFLDPVSSGR